MKGILSLFVLAITLGLNAQTPAVEYMDKFSNEYRSIQESMWDYTRTISHGKSARKVEKTRLELISRSDNALKSAQSTSGFNGSTAFKDSVVSYLRTLNLVLKQDYEKLVNMEEVAEQSYDAMEAYMLARELANDKQAAASKMIGEQQRIFAEANDINLIEGSDELSYKMEVADKVFSHYNEVYLVFFKSYKQEAYLINSMSMSDLSGIEQNKEALLATVSEGREKLKNIELYKGDETMVEATKNLFDFYEREVEGVQNIQDLLLKQEKFQKVKAAFDSKKEKDRTKEDVDQYNSSVNEMNTAVAVYNEWNNKTNGERSKFIDAWNNTASKFTGLHVPKGK
jgi:hypothetical protein